MFFRSRASHHWHPWKVVLFVCLFLLVGVFGWFGMSVMSYYGDIRDGGIDPLLKQRLDIALSRLETKRDVKAEDLAMLSDSTAPSIGASSATLTLVEFIDYSCPYSFASFQPLREMMEKYKGQMRVIIRDFPVEELHPRAIPAALAARCAQAQGKFLPYHDKLFTNQGHHEDADLVRYAREIGLNEDVFKNCYEKRVYDRRLGQELDAAMQVGVAGTPTFFFNGFRVPGTLDRPTLEYLIQRFLKAPSS